MRINFFSRKREAEEAGSLEMASVNARYNEYFPRIFAYVHSCGGDQATQDIVVRAFDRAFSRAGNGDEDRFSGELFRAARSLCRPALKDAKVGEGDPLSAHEREVISLVFDAGLSQDQVARLFRTRGKKVAALLIAGLRKLNQQASPTAAAASPNPA